ncbi:zinc finger MYM-type protein 1-like, partial [Aphis craccivora]
MLYHMLLNLCLINTIQNVPLVVNFFKTVQDLYKFLMSDSTRYELFIQAQQLKNIKVLDLERLVETQKYCVYQRFPTFLVVRTMNF